MQGCSVEGEKVRALLVGEGKGGELLTLLEEAIARGDHRYTVWPLPQTQEDHIQV